MTGINRGWPSSGITSCCIELFSVDLMYKHLGGVARRLRLPYRYSSK